jgi:RND family efflux transporter MFP subunit
MQDEVDKSRLLRELRLDRSQREEQQAADGRGRGLIVGIVAAALLIVAAVSYGLMRWHRIEVQAATAIEPSASSAATGSVLQATGYVTARREATVSAQITGTLKQVLIEEGERVQSGQVLAQLDDTAQRAALQQAQAQLAAGKALLAQYQAQLEQARRDLKRSQGLFEADAVSRQDAEQARTQADALEAQVAAQNKQIELAQAQVDGARVQLGYTVIRAPFSGVIVAKAAQPGEIVSPMSAGGGFTRTGVGTVVDMDSLEIDVDVNEAYINRVLPKQPARAVLDAYPDWAIPAHVIAIIPTADRSKATVKVRIGLDQKDPRILPDMGASVSFLEPADPAQPGALKPNGVFVPASAVVERDGHSVVFAIETDHAHQRMVHAGSVSGDLRLVEGLGAGTQVVRRPPDDLHDGSAVTITKE